jgi:hypothetical protein
MVTTLLAALCLMSLCVVTHAVGVASALGHVRSRTEIGRRFWRDIWLLIVLASWIIVLHLVEICVWAGFYVATSAMPDLPSALYFSAVTYTTTGYGNLVLPREWRLVGGVEALTGILMCGWSTGFFVAVVSRFHQPRSRTINA